jgi:2-dehydropantoate 2-reductase
MPGRRIAVLGAGANGASIGADLTEAGEDVTLIEQWPEHVEAMRAHGVRIEMPEETRQVPVRVLHFCEAATLRQPFDVVFMLVKAYDSRWAARLIEPLLARDGLLVGAQNGMTVDAVSAVVGQHRTIGCVIEITSMMFEPGIVERHSPPSRSWFAVGSIDPASAGREAEAAELLRHSGTVEAVTDIRAAKWMKLVSNATTLVTTAILGLPMIEAAAIGQMRALMLQSGQEALDAAVSLGHPILPIFGMTPEALGEPGQVVENLLDTLLAGFVMPTSKTTILQDWIKGRRSEAGDINGLVAATHAAAGRRAPANEAVVELARRIERDELTPGPGNLSQLLALAGAG